MWLISVADSNYKKLERLLVYQLKSGKPLSHLATSGVRWSGPSGTSISSFDGDTESKTNFRVTTWKDENLLMVNIHILFYMAWHSMQPRDTVSSGATESLSMNKSNKVWGSGLINGGWEMRWKTMNKFMSLVRRCYFTIYFK